MKLKYLGMYILTIILLFGCSPESSTMSKEDNTSKTEYKESRIDPAREQDNVDLISYEKYGEFRDYLANHLDLEGFQLKKNTDGTLLTFVSEKTSFGKRDYLTRDGHGGGKVEPTQDALIFENEDETAQVYLKLSYTTNFVGTDIINWTQTRAENSNKELNQKKDEVVVLSYKNIIFIVQVNESDKTDNEDLAYNTVTQINEVILDSDF